MSAFAHSRRILLTSRRIPLFTPLILLLIFALVFKYYTPTDTVSFISSFSSSQRIITSRPATFESDGGFWPSFAPLLAAAAPRVEAPEVTEQVFTRHRPDPGSDYERQGNVLQWSDSAVASMKGAHEWFLTQMRSNPPKLQYTLNTRGIVTSGGGKYFPVLLVSLRMLRRTGSTLPVEIFLRNRDEYEELACEVLFKDLGAKCVILSEFVGTSKIQFNFEHYQIKSFGLLFSSFEEILFLDADNFPVYKPDDLFEAEVYKQRGMVLWPDYWQCTSSPYFNQVTGLDENALQDRPTIETGQMLVDKKKHADTLSLAGYYNAYGDKYFYRLLSQGGAGEGDKETFAAAALVLNNSFYTMSERPRPFGGGGEGPPVLQSNLAEDWLVSLENPNRDGKAPAATPFFVHASWPPKLNPKYIQRSERMWGPGVESEKTFGEDLELTVWSIMVDMACEDNVQFADWGDKEHGGLEEGVSICDQTLKNFQDMFPPVTEDHQIEEESDRGESNDTEESGRGGSNDTEESGGGETNDTEQQ
ncbi:Alpha-1,2-mannosyltransferase [Lachnellula occidentalis]|uniref:Alpha-1,2-mannosyltransferase n=1 Tax=Lachnellula occidentalis TaxID=215460 RepID=A0A8H8RG43_9HELO|nr:Alpha-1,2-mannosyltransferase [Lachnellula occidentalis]